MAFNVSELKSQLTFGGARPSLFQVVINNPVNATANFKSPFMIKEASIPDSTISEIEVPYFGRSIKFAGDRKFADWEVTIINDEDFLVRNAMEEWMNSINSHESNVRGFAQASSEQYKANGQVQQLGKTGVVLREYTFYGLFPTTVAAIPLGWEKNNAIEEYSVTFAYDYWKISGGITGNAGTTQ